MKACQSTSNHLALVAQGYDPMRNEDHEDKVTELKMKIKEGRESPSAERDYFIIQDKLLRAVEERKRAAERGLISDNYLFG